MFFHLSGGLAALILGADLLVKGGSRLAQLLGLAPLVIGLTIVAFGTSAPEVAVSLQAGLNGQSDIAIGNVIGSNIFNILLILGISALIAPLSINIKLIRLDVPIMITVAVIAWLMALNDTVGRVEGLILFGGIIVYTAFLVWQGRRESRKAADITGIEDPPQHTRKKYAWIFHLLFILGGLALLVSGSNWFITGAVELARLLGLSELIIGLTIVSAGTSLPEVATSVVASIKGERDIAVGNVVGSNIFNILSVLGLTAIFVPGGVTVAKGVLTFDFPVMLAVSIACLPIFFTGFKISRWEGGVFLFYYIAYTTYLILNTFAHKHLELYNVAMIWFVIPLTAITLAAITIKAYRKNT
jgi:cation:H+ antiporter